MIWLCNFYICRSYFQPTHAMQTIYHIIVVMKTVINVEKMKGIANMMKNVKLVWNVGKRIAQMAFHPTITAVIITPLVRIIRKIITFHAITL